MIWDWFWGREGVWEGAGVDPEEEDGMGEEEGSSCDELVVSESWVGAGWVLESRCVLTEVRDSFPVGRRSRKLLTSSGDAL